MSPRLLYSEPWLMTFLYVLQKQLFHTSDNCKCKRLISKIKIHLQTTRNIITQVWDPKEYFHQRLTHSISNVAVPLKVIEDLTVRSNSSAFFKCIQEKKNPFWKQFVSQRKCTRHTIGYTKG